MSAAHAGTSSPLLAATSVPRLRPALRVSDAPRGVVVSTADGRVFELSREAGRLLGWIDGIRPVEEIARLLSVETGREVTAGETARILTDLFGTRGLLDAFPEPVEPSPRAGALRLRTTLLSPAAARSLSRRLGLLFHPVVAAVAAVAAAATYLRLVGRVPDLPSPLEPSAWPVWLGGGALYLATGFLHELGHAAALLRAGEAPGRIGMGFYGVIPVLFTDAERAWHLTPRRRVAVDLGGIHVQFLCGGAMLAVDAIRPSPFAVVASLFVLVAIIVNLNPFLRMDGYWVLCDLLGVSDLAGRARRLFAGADPAGDPGVRRWAALYAAGSGLAVIAFAAWGVVVGVPLAGKRIAAARVALDAGASVGERIWGAILAAGVLLGLALYGWVLFRSLRTLVAMIRVRRVDGGVP